MSLKVWRLARIPCHLSWGGLASPPQPPCPLFRTPLHDSLHVDRMAHIHTNMLFECKYVCVYVSWHVHVCVRVHCTRVGHKNQHANVEPCMVCAPCVFCVHCFATVPNPFQFSNQKRKIWQLRNAQDLIFKFLPAASFYWCKMVMMRRRFNCRGSFVKEPYKSRALVWMNPDHLVGLLIIITRKESHMQM